MLGATKTLWDSPQEKSQLTSSPFSGIVFLGFCFLEALLGISCQSAPGIHAGTNPVEL